MATYAETAPLGRDSALDASLAVREEARAVLLNRISWGAVLAGIATALVVQMLLNILGIGLGFASLDPQATAAENPDSVNALLAAGGWWIGSGLIGAFVGGIAAGRLSGKPVRTTAAWHGFVAWAGTTLIVIYLITTTAGTLLGGALGTVGRTLGGVGQAATQAAQAAAPAIANASDPFGAIEQQVRDASGGNDPAALRDAAVSAMRAAVTGDQAQAQSARDRATEALAKAQNISPDEARAQVEKYEQQYRASVEQAKQQTAEAAAAATTAVSRGALTAFGALLIGAIAGWLGGLAGTTRPGVPERLRS